MGLDGWIWALDGWILVAAVLCAVSCSLLGNFLVLRGTSMLGDAISHAVLPGLAVAFWISGSRSGTGMFVAAVAAAVVTVFLIETLRRSAGVDRGASMGVVFTAMFALGMIMIVQVADHVDLDPNCVLYGSIELTPLDQWEIAGWLIPKAVVTLGVTLLLNGLFVALFYKELLLTTFDSDLADSMGFSSQVIHYGLMTLVAITAVASFESVGSVLVVAMMVVPPASALMMTDRLSGMLAWSAGLAALAAIMGHGSAIVVPSWFGMGSTLTSGMMAVSAGGILIVCGLVGSRRGLITRWVRQRAFAAQVAADDVLGFLFRLEERAKSTVLTTAATTGQKKSESITAQNPATAAQLSTNLGQSLPQCLRVLSGLVRRGEVEPSGSGYCLTSAGRRRAQLLVRSHRLWELYLVEQAQYEIDRIHEKAEAWEHVTDESMRESLDRATSQTALDPHGSQIPPEVERHNQ
ncbi:MAG: metal ABC transporter permease [Planctomycetaceae bacterium]|nr:metal ABC transporter permease [Planctomycetaceae bacterium]